MTIGETVKNTKDGVAVIAEIIKAAGESPNVKEAGQELGKTALTLTKAINTVLLPIAAVNFAFDKARRYFEEEFQLDIVEKSAKIPPEKIIEPKASIAGPALQGLAFSHEEQNLKEMYLNLLASAMDSRESGAVHPGFVEIVRQLSATEAGLLKDILKSSDAIPIVELRLQTGTGSGHHFVLRRHLLDLRDQETQVPVEEKMLPVMIDNWVRLGLVEVNYGKYLTDEGHYSWVDARPEFQQCCSQAVDVKSVVFQKGVMRRTAWGEQFSEAAGL